VTPALAGLAAVIGTQIAYPLVSGSDRARLVVVTVVLGYALSVGHARATRGWRAAAILVLVTTGGGLAVEALGVATGFPFGRYGYGGGLGPRLFGVPLVVALAWTWMAWPAFVAAATIVRPAVARVGVAALGLASWDLFLDPQMVRAGYWQWQRPGPALPGVAGVPLTNYLGWLAVALVLMALVLTALLAAGTPMTPVGPADRPMLALYLWTYYSSVLAHLVFLHLPASAAWGALGMGFVAIPLTVWCLRPVAVWRHP
jgi:uncharacterized membrane protein